MGKLTNYATSKLIDHIFKTTYTPVSTLYFALCTATPTVTSTGSTITETDYTGYSRISFTASLFNTAASRIITQGTELILAPATGTSTSDINSWAIIDASTGGNVLAYGLFNTAWNVVNGNTPKIASGQIQIATDINNSAEFTDICINNMLNLMFRNVSWSKPDIYAGLATVTLSHTSTTATEHSGDNYTRIQIPTTSINSASAGVTTNSAIITWPIPSATWGTITTIALFDALTSGNLLAYDNDNVIDQPVNANDTVQIDIGNFNISLS